jgi:hypothetical protein
MVKLNKEEGRYRVVLLGIGNNTDEEKSSFCQNISKHYSIPSPLLEKIVDRYPVVLKKNIPLIKAEILAKSFKAFGASISIEERRHFPPISLEFQELIPHRLALESSDLRKTQRGIWSVVGRAKNISDETLSDIWVLAQLFEESEEFVAFEETPLPINPLPPGGTSPFKVVFEGDLSVKRVSIAFKTASGQPIPAVDERKKKEWVEVAMEGEGFLPSLKIATEPIRRVQAVGMAKPEEGKLHSMEKVIPREVFDSLEEMVGGGLEKEMKKEKGGDEERSAEDSLLASPETLEKALDSSLDLFEEERSPGAKESEKTFEQETLGESASPASDDLEEKAEESALGEPEEPSVEEKTGESSHRDVSVLEEPAQLMKDISEGPKEREEELEGRKGVSANEQGVPSIPWIEYFRNAVEAYYQRKDDIFSVWFKECQGKEEFRSSFHALLTILVHCRFDQGNESAKALENTKRVFRIIVPSNLSLDEVPPLEGTPFASGEVWRDLFHRAIPKLKQISNAILEKNRWNASGLEQLLQVIPHVGDQNSRRAIHWINELMGNEVEVDFSDIRITIGEDLYRVASRLGVVNPDIDYYRGRNSIADEKIQSFAKAAFPQNPLKVVEPMAGMGKEEERGGHCFPVNPWCEGCLFETFCPRLFVDFNPSEKGMRE